MTRVSVCLATYNGERELREQMDSILSQLQCDDELVISDDNSNDKTRSIVSSYNDARVRLITNPSRRGHVGNFANAIAHATGQFIALSDQDDIWVDHRLERMLNLMKEQPELSLVIGDFIEFNKTGQLHSLPALGPSPKNGLFQLPRIFLGRAKYWGCTFLFRRDLTRFILPIPRRIESHDIWIAMIACIHGRVGHLQEVTLLRRVHDRNLSEPRRGLPIILRSRINYFLGLIQASVR
jgi:glycosyltransferase involved in cell wall biosynthesis